MKEETLKTIAYAIDSIDNFLKTDHTFKSLLEHISLQKHLMSVLARKVNPSIFDYIKESATFDELYKSRSLIAEYYKWLFSIWKPKEVIEYFNKIFESDNWIELFKTLERGALALRPIHSEPASEWWFKTYDANLLFHVGISSDAQIAIAAAEKSSDKDKTVYAYGEYQTLIAGELLGIKSERTPKVVNEIFNIFKKVKYRTNIPLHLESEYYKKLLSNYDDSAEYAMKIHEAITKWKPKEASKMLFNGSLKGFTGHRAYSRWIDREGGRIKRRRQEALRDKFDYTDFQEPEDEVQPHEEKIDKDVKRAMWKSYESEEINKKVEDQNKDLIENILNLLPKDSTDYKMLKYWLGNPKATQKEIGEKFNISDKAVRYAMERIKKQVASINY